MELKRKIFTFLLTAVVFVSFSSFASANFPNVSSVVNKVSDSVVHVKVIKEPGKGTSNSNGGPRIRIPGMPELEERIEEWFSQRNQREELAPRYQAGSGSGFVISEDGYIVTNLHVVDSADQILIRFQDRRELVAELVGSDKLSDLALLKVDADNLAHVNFANVNALRRGDWVVALGSPFEFDFSVTAGVISALGRSLPNNSGLDYVPFIQSDVVINPGSSGGPLFNLEGEVVGVNSQIFTRTGAFSGVSFSIPAHVVMNVIEQLQENGSVERGWLGIAMQEITAELSDSLGLNKPTGALVTNVFEGSPAEEAGIKQEDVIISVDDTDIIKASDLPHTIGLINPGDKATFAIWREGRKKTLTAEIGMLEEDRPLRTAYSSELQDTLGLRLEESRRGYRDVLVVSELEYGPASLSGLRVGDQIESINGVRVGSLDEFNEALSELNPKRSVRLGIRRGSNRFYLAIRR